MLTLTEKEQCLRDYILSPEVTIANFEKGYVDASKVNQEIDSVLRGYAADIIADYFRNKGITKIAGIPMMGISLGAVVSDRLKIIETPGRKGHFIKPSAFASKLPQAVA